MSQTDEVWAQTRYDSGLYACRVVRDGDHGRLTIELVGTISHTIHQEKVKCDRADTDRWRTRCVEVINNPDLRLMEQR